MRAWWAFSPGLVLRRKHKRRRNKLGTVEDPHPALCQRELQGRLYGSLISPSGRGQGEGSRSAADSSRLLIPVCVPPDHFSSEGAPVPAEPIKSLRPSDKVRSRPFPFRVPSLA